MSDFSGKNVLITGAASGIGRLLARKIAAAGARVVLWDVDEPGLEGLQREIEGEGGRASIYCCDVSEPESVYRTAERVLAQQGPVDVLINNAGVVSGRSILEASDEEIRRTFAVNALALFWTVRAFLPAMAARNAGHIVTIASAGGLVGSPRLTDYCASKFAAVGFDEALRLELRRQGLAIRTTLVCPFYVRTGMFAGVKTRFPRLLPLLDPEYVAGRVIGAIRKNRRRVFMPRLVYIAPPLRLLPSGWFDAVVGFLGVTRAMDEFRGRPR